ncbi:methyl-accepting chemotaxis protein [Brevundimonas sp. VNH65]|uniref:methyl-accepting chemotaxis protein n=1 Tax=Brevundimonas sp. VNH65 TaxID=3400917 RepID=UPI003BFD19A1
MIFQTRSLAEQRRFGAVVVLILAWALCISAVLWSLMLHGAVVATSTGALALALIQTGVWRFGKEGGGARTLAAILLMAQVSLLVAALDGHAWQIDLHMAYFAALAVLMIHCDWRVILVGAATVAVHHLVLSFLLPEMVFPGSASLGRVLVHAVILVVEAGVLAWSAASVNAMFDSTAASQKVAEESAQQARSAAQEAESTRHQADQQSRAVAERDRASAEEQAEIVRQTAAGMAALAAGDLSYRIPGRFPAAYLKLQDDFNSAMTSLQQAMSEIGANADGIAGETAEISRAADDLSSRTERQAAMLEQTAAALDEAAASVRLAADGAEQASGAMSRAQAEADQSRPVVKEAMSAMDEIEASSEQINQIIGLIDEIAFQTNLLALNAGVEAARAGDAGRGFAVVASEVRALAQRSAEAARDIKALISTSRDQVKNGVVLVGRTGAALGAIAERVTEIGNYVTQITASAREQATTLQEINRAVNDMDQTTQQNAAMVEQSTAACEALNQDAGRLAALVGRFKLTDRNADANAFAMVA